MTHGFSPDRLARVRDVTRGFVERGEIAGVVALTSRRGAEAIFVAEGAQDLEAAKPMRRDTIFRIASMTKPIVAAALLTLVDDGKLSLFDPIDRWLPELADRRVMRDPNGALDDVVPSPRPITLHDILTYRLGLGWGPSALHGPLFAMIASPLAETQRIPNEPLAPDAWMARLGAMPLPYAPGTRWLYHTAGDLAGVLLARVTGEALPDALRRRIFEPLGMKDTGFTVPAEKRARLAVLYTRHKDREGFRVVDGANDTRWGTPPLFPSGGGGLVGTADDFQRFGLMLLGGGALYGARVLSRKIVEVMTTDYLTPEQHGHPFSNFDRYDLDGGAMWAHRGFGYGLAVRTSRVGYGPSVGAFYWPGAFGTTWMADPAEGLMTTFLVQSVAANPFYSRAAEAHLEAVYRAIDD